MKNFETFVEENKDKTFRYWVYNHKDNELQCEECAYGKIGEYIELPDGDVLLGFVDYTSKGDKIVEYQKLSNIELMYCSSDDEEE